MLHSIEKLLNYRFEWVLAGHGDRVNLPTEEMQTHLRFLVDQRRSALAS
jgi:hypothetical protein